MQSGDILSESNIKEVSRPHRTLYCNYNYLKALEINKEEERIDEIHKDAIKQTRKYENSPIFIFSL